MRSPIMEPPGNGWRHAHRPIGAGAAEVARERSRHLPQVRRAQAPGAGWDTDPHRISEQVTFTDGRIVVVGRKARRRPGKRADYILRFQVHNDRLVSSFLPDLFIRVALPADRILPEYFVVVWNSPATRVALEDNAKTTSGIWKVNQGNILSTEILVPSITDQHHIVRALTETRTRLNSLIAVHGGSCAELDALMPAILDRAFKGEL